MAGEIGMSTESRSEVETSVLEKAGLSYDDLYNAAKYIQYIRVGVPGSVVRSLIEALNIPRFVVSGILKVDESNVARLYQRSRVSETQSESIMDTTRLLLKAANIFGDQERASEWFQAPVPALGNARPYEVIDTFEGRKWIDQVLAQIEYGEFI